VQIHQKFTDQQLSELQFILIKCHRHHNGLCMYNQDAPIVNRSQYVHIWETGTYKISGFFLYSYWCLDIF